MKKEELLKYCRYYHGEKNNPYVGRDEEYLFIYEYAWVQMMMQDDDEVISTLIDDYIDAGLAHFSEQDNVPITLKAVMYNRFAQHNEMFTIKEYKDWYLQHYSH